MYPFKTLYSFVCLLLVIASFSCSKEESNRQQPVQTPTHSLVIPADADSLDRARMQQMNDWHNSFEIDPEAAQDSVVLLEIEALSTDWRNNKAIPPIFLARSLRLQGWILANEELYEASILRYQDALDVLDQSSQEVAGYFYEYAYCYNLIGNSYFENFKYGLAEDNFLISLNSNLKHGLYIEAMKDYVSIASVYESNGNVFEAGMMIDSAYLILNTYGDYLSNRNDTLAAYGVAHKNAGVTGRKAQLALYTSDTAAFSTHIHEMLSIYHEADFRALEKDTLHNNGYYLMQWYVTVSNFARLDRNNSTLSDTAMLYAQKLIDLENIGSIYKVVGHNARADLFSLKDCEQGLIETEKAEAILKLYLDYFQGYANMPAEAKIIYISSQIIKSKVLYHCAIEKDDPGLLARAADIGKESTNNFQQLISRSSIGELKNRFIDYYLYLTTLTEIYIQQYLTSKDIRYLEKAFVVSEQNRSVLLQQSLSQKEKQETLSGKRKVLLNQLQELNETKFNTEAKYQQGDVADSVFYNAINAQQTFFDQLQYSKDPIERSFYLDQIKVKELNISTVRKDLLNSNNCIISFQKIYNKVYLFALTKNKLNLFSTSYDRDLYQLIQIASKSLEDQSDEDRKDSYQFYRKLFEPCLSWLKTENITELILIQNQYLEDLTIEQLPMAYDARKTWNQLPLIIDTFTCSYAYSIQSLLAAKELYLLRQQKQQRLPNWQGFTNIPETGRDTLPALSGLGAEIPSRFKSQFSPNSDHTYNGDKSTILQGLEKASIGQLVTHGRTTEAREDLFYLDISVNKQDAERKNIYPIDIYSRSFPLDLLLLLNCNSGKEQTINQFFGRQSIAHAFTYAGCTTTIVGLDNLKDQATSTIVNYFYENYLVKKQPVAMALRMAKQRYRTDNPSAHPYMWSKLIVQGVADINFHD